MTLLTNELFGTWLTSWAVPVDMCSVMTLTIKLKTIAETLVTWCVLNKHVSCWLASIHIVHCHITNITVSFKRWTVAGVKGWEKKVKRQESRRRRGGRKEGQGRKGRRGEGGGWEEVEVGDEEKEVEVKVNYLCYCL